MSKIVDLTARQRRRERAAVAQSLFTSRDTARTLLKLIVDLQIDCHGFGKLLQRIARRGHHTVADLRELQQLVLNARERRRSPVVSEKLQQQLPLPLETPSFSIASVAPTDETA